MNYDIAIKLVERGLRVSRLSWNGSEECLVHTLGIPKEHLTGSAVNGGTDKVLPNGKKVPWRPTHEDIAACDWITRKTGS